MCENYITIECGVDCKVAKKETFSFLWKTISGRDVGSVITKFFFFIFGECNIRDVCVIFVEMS